MLQDLLSVLPTSSLSSFESMKMSHAEMNHSRSSYGTDGSSYAQHNNSRKGRPGAGSSNGWSGTGYDRWVERNTGVPQNTTLGKVQRQFWFTKSAVMRKLGKNQDEHVVASDAELDAKMELFKAIDASTRELQSGLAEYQSKVCVLAQEENSMGRLLKEWGRQDRGTASQVMTATGKSLSYTAQQRLALRAPLVRLFQEVDTFQTRAIEDTGRTLAQMEKMRTEYRGALMWMKNISQDFNPDQYSQLEKFRQVQEIVRQKKAKFDALKIKCIQKIDLLAASRCNMFSHALILYQNAIILFSEKTAKTLNSVASNFQGYQHYNFQVIKELAEPESRRAIDDDDDDGKNMSSDDKTFFEAEYHDEEEQSGASSEGHKNLCSRHRKPASHSNNTAKDSDSLFNFFDASEEDTQKNASQNGNETTAANKDLLCDDADTEKDTQQMLKDLFDSPEHKLQPQSYSRAFSLSDSAQGLQTAASTSQQEGGQFWTQRAQQSRQMFMPSHLLDYGILDWGQGGGQASGKSPLDAFAQDDLPPALQQFSSSSDPTRATSDVSLDSSDQQSFSAGTTQQSLKPQRTDGSTGPVAATGTAAMSGADEAGDDKDSKVDWYRVFQDIDPLSDPSNPFFNKKGEESGAC